MERVKCLIIGSGPAGYTAAIYASRANLAPVLYEGNLSGGQLTTTSEVENFPGYPEGINGFDMMDDIRRQAERFGTDIRMGTVTKADLSSSPYNIYIEREYPLDEGYSLFSLVCPICKVYKIMKFEYLRTQL